MKRVFIGGSRRVSEVDDRLAPRLDAIIEQGLEVVIGDAPGFDLAAQRYLADRAYERVTVYCTNGTCRHNVADWPTRPVPHRNSRKDLAFFTAKDDAMIQDADYGLFAWDARSKGTARNIRRMAELSKASVVYLTTSRQFREVRRPDDLNGLGSEPNPGGSPSPASLFDATRRAAG